MIALPAAPAYVTCIDPVKADWRKTKSFVEVRGQGKSVQTWLHEASSSGAVIVRDRYEPKWRSVTLLMPRNASYHTIGKLIYTGQANGLSVTMKTEPPICGAEAK